MRCEVQKWRWRCPRGFVLAELMTVLAILLLSVVLVLPSFQGWLMRDRVEQAARALLDSFRLARNEAERSAQKITLCRFDGAHGCAKTNTRCGQGAQASTDNWACGWLVMRGNDGNDSSDTSQAHILHVAPAWDALRISSPATPLSFTPPVGEVLGSFRDFEIGPASARPEADASRLMRCIRIAAGGRARISDGACGAGS